MKSFCEVLEMREESELKYGFDFRLPQYRREVFLRFYEFHLKYRAHAGGVYYAFPYIWKKNGLDGNQKLWFCFINGCSQNVVSTNIIFEAFPDLNSLKISRLERWWRENSGRLAWDTDRRFVRKRFPEMVLRYKNLVGENQSVYFSQFLKSADPKKNFSSAWETVLKNFVLFGRLATFSYLEYLRIAGLYLDCDRLFLEDIKGSKSHRNGIMKVAGRDDYDWQKKNPVTYTPEIINWAKEYAEELLEESRERIDHPDVSYFTLETTLCNFKGWFRKNRRYPNVYNDMFFDRIKKAERKWPKEDFSIFWEARKNFLPKNLRLEDNPGDLGVHPLKQNHFRLTGQVIMMDRDWDCFRNEYNDKFTKP
jgi:hypothetical protein